MHGVWIYQNWTDDQQIISCTRESLFLDINKESFGPVHDVYYVLLAERHVLADDYEDKVVLRQSHDGSVKPPEASVRNWTLPPFDITTN